MNAEMMLKMVNIQTLELFTNVPKEKTPYQLLKLA